MKTRNLFFPGVSLVSLVFTFLMLGSNTVNAQQEESENRTLSPFFVVISEHPETDNLPLKETSANVNIVGVIADVTVKQVYVNSGKNTLEAIYTFPLSTKAAVYAMQMTIGKRIITAKIEEKEKARKDYENAKNEGKRASLLEQSRPNVFTMNVANILVNDTIIVELKYTELLVPENGVYSFIYPTVVGPRYSNKPKENSGADDQYINTPYTRSGVMPTYKYGIELNIHAGIPVQDVVCPTHKTLISYPDLYTSIVKLDPGESNGGNRDVILHYSLQGNKIESGLMLYENGDENFFLLMVQPPKKILKEEIPPREYVFIVDVSGSMNGFPLEISKKLLRNLILNLNPSDKFNVVLFAGNTGLLQPASLDANQANIDKAIRFIDKQSGGGGTELLPALKVAYNLPRTDEDISRSFVIVTDGYVDIEKEAFEFIRKNSGNSNFFSFGIGSSVNRFLIEGMAFMGNGEPMIITKPEMADEQAEKFRTYINTPVLTRIRTSYDSFHVYDIEPSASPDMLAERPVIIFGKYKENPSGTITLKGKAGRKPYEQTFDVSRVKPNPAFSAIRYLWAREKIKLLDYYAANNEYGNSTIPNDNIKEITNLGLKYNLMTNYTSFIAIDEQIIADSTGKIVRVKQALPLPEGVSDYAVGYDVQMSGIGGQINIKSKGSVMMEEVEVAGESAIFTLVEEMPSFPGGDAARSKFLMDNIVYPEIARKNNIQGTVYLSFFVNRDGSISVIKVLRGVSPEIDLEAIRVVKMMPNWIPGKQNGKTVRIQMNIPVKFSLEK